MKAPMLKATLLGLLILPVLAQAKDEIIPTRRKTKQRQGKQNPLYDVADEMDTAARRLAEVKTDDTTQDVQKRIIKKLDYLIELARQQSQQPPKGGDGEKKKRQQQKRPQPKPGGKQQKKAGKPKQSQSQQKSNRPGFGPGAKGEGSGKLHTDAEEWGNLPPAIRDQLLQTQGEGFPLKYRELLRRYYRQLAKPKD